jgi:glycine/D-amino acid oxidase-like deaminating enzyme
VDKTKEKRDVKPGISLWQDEVTTLRHGILQGEKKTEVLIVGGGLTGILCSYMLLRNGIDCMVVERDRVGSGITANTTAKITSQHGLIYQKLLDKWGKEKASLYLKASEDAILQYAELASKIDCGFLRCSNLVYSLDNRREIERELRALESLGFAARFRKETTLPFQVAGAVEFPLQAAFHPLKLIEGLLKGPLKNLSIFEKSQVIDIEKKKNGKGFRAFTEQGAVSADAVIVASHFPFLDRRGRYFLKMYQSRSYVVAGRGGANLDGMYVDASSHGMSFRNCGDLLLVGGGSARPGKIKKGWRELIQFCQEAYPDWETAYCWANQDCITLDGVPYIGVYYPGSDGMYVATGFNKWGMTSAMVAAHILTDMIQGKDSPYTQLFEPSRSMLHPQLLANGLESTINLLTPTVPRCRHLGCALKWNQAEGAWECSCHGSRYDEEGRCTENPSTRGFSC